jgi:K+/H+ antiporter YhaU regulatory subunit KhtT
MLANPTPQTVLTTGDLIGLIGADEQITKAKQILAVQTTS